MAPLPQEGISFNYKWLNKRLKSLCVCGLAGKVEEREREREREQVNLHETFTE